jgi:hypothetical protein
MPKHAMIKILQKENNIFKSFNIIGAYTRKAAHQWHFPVWKRKGVLSLSYYMSISFTRVICHLSGRSSVLYSQDSLKISDRLFNNAHHVSTFLTPARLLKERTL